MKHWMNWFKQGLGFIITIWVIGVVYAATISSVNTGDSLTAAKWNELVTAVNAGCSSPVSAWVTLQHFPQEKLAASVTLTNPNRWLIFSKTITPKKPTSYIIVRYDAQVYHASNWYNIAELYVNGTLVSGKWNAAYWADSHWWGKYEWEVPSTWAPMLLEVKHKAEGNTIRVDAWATSWSVDETAQMNVCAS